LVQLETSKITPEIRNALNKRFVFVMDRLYQRLHGDPAGGVLAVYSQEVSSNVCVWGGGSEHPQGCR